MLRNTRAATQEEYNGEETDITNLRQAEAERKRLLTQVEQERERVSALAQILEAERDVLDTIMENTHTRLHLAYLDPQFHFVKVNSTYAQGSGHSKEELIGHNHFELFPNAENQAIFEKVRDTGVPVEFRAKPFVYADQPERGVTYWNWSLVPVKDADGHVQGLVLSLVDVTERERAKLEREQHLARLDKLIAVSEQVLAETTLEGILQGVVDAARELTGARLGTSGHIYKDGSFRVLATSRVDSTSPCPPGELFLTQRGGVYLDLMERETSIRLTDEQLRTHSAWWGLPEGHAPLRGLLGARLVGRDGQANGLIMLSDKEQGDFTAEDEALLAQLATIASLALQHIEARGDAERRANELDAIFAAMTDVVVVYNADGIPLRANPAAVLAFGLDPTGRDRMVTAKSVSLRHPDGRPVSVDELPTSQALRGVKVVDEPLVFTNVEGQALTIHASASPLITEGRVSGAVLIWHDVTEREHLLTQLEAEQARLKAIIENAPEGIVVADQEGRIVLANPAARRLYARPIPYGQDFESHAQPALCSPDGRPYDPRQLPLTRAVLDGETTTNVETTILWPDGQRRDLLVSSAPIRDSQGLISGAVGVFQDITEHERARRELQQRTAQLETLRQVGLQLVAELNLDTLLHSIVSQALKLLGVDSGVLYLYRPERELLEWVVSVNLDPAFIGSVRRKGEGLTGKVWQTGKPLIVDDYQNWPERVAQYGSQPVASALGVPIYWGDEFLGVLNVIHGTPRAFGSADMEMLGLLATQAAIAIRNARLMAEQAEQRRRAEALARATAALTSTLELEPLLENLLSAAIAATLVAKRGVVLLLDEETHELRVRAQIGYTNPYIRQARFGRDKQSLLWTVLDGQSMLIPDTQAKESQYTGLVTEAQPPQSAVIAPLRYLGKAIGVVVLTSADRKVAFTEADMALLTTFAAEAAGAVENARLFTEAQGKATLEERQRLAHALHDSVTQSLYSLTLFAHAAQEWAEAGQLDKVKGNLIRISETAQQSLKEMRLLVYQLRPSNLQKEGLVEALHHRLDAVEKRAGVEARIVAEQLARLPTPIEEALYYIAQEALNNALKHAAANSVTVYLRADGAYVELEVVDDGKGFDAGVVSDKGGLGLITMRERAESIGGSLGVSSAPGNGTTVKARVKIQKE